MYCVQLISTVSPSQMLIFWITLRCLMWYLWWREGRFMPTEFCSCLLHRGITQTDVTW